jgi:hypothetical protein
VFEVTQQIDHRIQNNRRICIYETASEMSTESWESAVQEQPKAQRKKEQLYFCLTKSGHSGALEPNALKSSEIT